MNTFYLIVIALAIGYLVAERLKVPPILAAIVVGIVAKIAASQSGLHVGEEILLIQDIGIMLLLFNAGVLIEIPDLLKAKKYVLVLMATQVGILGPLAFLLGKVLFSDPMAPTYAVLLVILNSTAVVVAVMVARGQLGTFAWNVLIGVMVAQDILAAIALTIVTAPGDPSLAGIAILLVKAIVVACLAMFVGRYLPRWFDKYQSPIGVALGALAWAGLVGFATSSIGLSREIGAFIAGLAVSRTLFKSYVASALEFISGLGLLMFFFVTGLNMNFEPRLVPAIAAYALLILFGTPVVLTLVSARSGIARGVSALIGGIPNQASEFILVIATLAVTSGKLQSDTAQVFIGAVVIAMVGSIVWSSIVLEPFKRVIERTTLLNWLDRWVQKIHDDTHEGYEYLILGFNLSVAMQCAKKGKTLVVVDDPGLAEREARKDNVFRVVYAPLDSVPSLLKYLSTGLSAVFSTQFTATADDSALVEVLRQLGNTRPRVTMMVSSATEAMKYRQTGLFTQILSAEEVLNQEVLK